MEIFFGAVLLILVAAVVLLFAMLGELGSRLPTERETAAARDTEIWPLDDARLGAEPGRWPAELTGLAAGSAGLDAAQTVLVLSTACSTCKDVAQQLSDELDRGAGNGMAVVVSTGERARGERFVQQYGLERLTHYVDEGGSWVADEFNVRMSPTALVMRGGRLESALVFQDVQALRTKVNEPKGVS
ncbi:MULTISPECIES: hypothetical protein [Actinomadura]|uniref:Thioredoxin domain-containing protein n=1 Tax=Actinomadura madurae TaxID=1993 RepID=A0A1I5IS03_9ACTN|nr:hypothetical protein [Actinomadura madurae]SFO63272.1 hypothetical protein SAMN04489713_10816 [Actinomadura madurae]SPT58360.1 Uncharacterised protein [Actinomadura madurae]